MPLPRETVSAFCRPFEKAGPSLCSLFGVSYLFCLTDELFCDII